MLFDRNYEDAYTDPGSPATARTPLGTYTLAQLAGPSRRLLLQVGKLSSYQKEWLFKLGRAFTQACKALP